MLTTSERKGKRNEEKNNYKKEKKHTEPYQRFNYKERLVRKQKTKK